MHGPCRNMNLIALCMKDSICQKYYPKSFQESIQENYNEYPIYRRWDTRHFVETKDRVQLDNRWVISYNIALIIKYNTHINVEICTSVLAVQYLYKYVYKGHDRAIIALSQKDYISNHQTLPKSELINEIKIYLDARYVSASESIWRIFDIKYTIVLQPFKG